MMKLEILQTYATQLGIPAVGVAPYPLPIQALPYITEQHPCPFTTGSGSERLAMDLPFTGKSAIVCLFPYYVPYNGPSNISRYTWGEDYHLVIHRYLERFALLLQETEPSMQFSLHCDTSPLADRLLAYYAGLGFFGVNRSFINPTWGSYVLIGTIVTDLDLPPATPMNQSCAQCRACVRQCPGRALSEHSFSFSTCKSYLTQRKGELSEQEIDILRDSPLIFGCDICQDVCVHNRHIPTTPIPEFQHIEPMLDVDSIHEMTNRQFKESYGHRAFSWRGKGILLRNHDYITNKKPSS